MKPRKSNLPALLACGLLSIAGLASRFYAAFSSVSNYPLATYWSESGRIFAAAQAYARPVLGVSLPLPWLDPGRALLDGLILLIPGSQIWMFRLWVAVLSVLMTGLASLLVIRLARRRSPAQASGRVQAWALVLLVSWGFLFLMQMPIYYHILLGVVLLLCWFDPDKPRLTLAAVVVASAWEGLCRVNWFLLPAALAVTIYLLSVPWGDRQLTSYLKWPLIWAVSGLAASVLVYGLFIRISGYEIPFLDPNMHYGFFRFKLWPNAGFALGLIPGILLVSAPVVALIMATIWGRLRSVHWVRLLGILLVLGVFFVGGTVVSLRAGGGFDLHNYDAYALLLFVVGILWGMGSVVPDKAMQSLPVAPIGRPWVLAALLVIPVCLAFRSIPARADQPEQEARAAIQQVQSFMQSADTSKGPVLVIYGRHLFVYRMITGIDLFLPYEKIELMEMAMANNRLYLDGYLADMQNHRFSYIISGMMVQNSVGVEEPFGYENNVWGGYVAYPIIEYYELVYFNPVGLAIYAPK